MYRAVVEESAILGIVGAFVATYLGQAIGWYGPDQNAGFIGAIVGAAIILLVWGFIKLVDEFEFDIIHHAARAFWRARNRIRCF